MSEQAITIEGVPCTCGASMCLDSYLDENIIDELSGETVFSHDDVPAEAISEIEKPSHCDECLRPIEFTTSENADGTYTIYGTCMR